jgi:pyrroloquinoline quinone biosynthesis protein E
MVDSLHDHPKLAPKARLQADRLTGESVLLYPEGVLRLNRTGAAIIAACDGSRSLAEIAAALAEDCNSAPARIADETSMFLRELQLRRLILWDARLPPENSSAARAAPANRFHEMFPAARLRPLGLLAELTYRCPLHCPYCSNPTTLPGTRGELPTAEWERVLGEAAALGVLHVHFSGGEPLLHPDLARLVAAAREAGMYTNLLTSGCPLTRRRAERLRRAGLDHVQLSFQADEAGSADHIAGAAAHATKVSAARLIRDFGWPLTVNVVLHRENIQRVPQLVAMAESLGAERLELANVQFYGWAHQNRPGLLPTREALVEAGERAREARWRLRGAMEVIYVLPDALADRPKPCMGGWGRRQMTINPVGDVLPCPNAGCIPSLRFENVRQRSLHAIWENSEAFNRFRGGGWMPEPCRSCSYREIDFGGCRCQAYLLTGDAGATDPVCALSRHHLTLSVAIESDAWVYRRNPDRSTAEHQVEETSRCRSTC